MLTMFSLTVSTWSGIGNANWIRFQHV